MKKSPNTLTICVEDTVTIGVIVTHSTPYHFEYFCSATETIPVYVWQVTNQANAPSSFLTGLTASGF